MAISILKGDASYVSISIHSNFASQIIVSYYNVYKIKDYKNSGWVIKYSVCRPSILVSKFFHIQWLSN